MTRKIASTAIPQADSLEIVLRVLEIVARGDTPAPALLQLHARQVAYYRAACRILGTVDDDGALTTSGRDVLAEPGAKILALARAFERCALGRELLAWHGVSSVAEVDVSRVIPFLTERTTLAKETIARRASTLRSWLEGFQAVVGAPLLLGDWFEAWLHEVPYSSRASLRRIAAGVVERDPVKLLSAVERHVAEGEAQRVRNEFVDVITCRRLATLAKRLVATIPTLSDEGRAGVLIAIHYFALSDDGEDDFASPVGFDDDAVVLETLVRRLGRADLLEVA